MFEVVGSKNSAIVYTDVIDEGAVDQIRAMCELDSLKGSKIRIMPDVHIGAGCVIGTTLTLKDTVIPNMVGVDIGCGMSVAKLNVKDLDFKKLDLLIKRDIPAGINILKEPKDGVVEIVEPLLANLKCEGMDINRAYRSIGTLGGGNHFIEIGKDDENSLYLIIHSGSRKLGNDAAQYYQNKAYEAIAESDSIKQVNELIDKLKSENRHSEIEDRVKELKKGFKASVDKVHAHLEGEMFDNYINDMKIIQKFASLNRKYMIDTVLQGMGIEAVSRFETIHNYIDIDSMILRKGAVSAKCGETLLIPINMRDGSLLCRGKGNSDWNYSAPHGAGRLYSRAKSKEIFDLAEFKSEMQKSGIYTSSVNEGTLDECPMAYKGINDIIDNIEGTVEILQILKPVYNFKSK